MEFPTLVQNPSEFLVDLKERIPRAEKRIWLQAMVMETGEVFSSLEPLLLDAAGRGVDVRIYHDWVTERYLHGNIRLLPTFNDKLLAEEDAVRNETKALFARLAAGGVHFVEVNKPLMGIHFLPVMGRNHIKIYIVDDHAWMGGMNFFDASFKNLDFMVRFENADMVQALATQFVQVNDKRPAQDYSFSVDKYGTVLVDSGIKGRSLIYKEAVKLVTEAQKEIVFVSQMVPEHYMLELLLSKSKQGVNVTIYTSNEDDVTFTKFPLRYFYIVFKRALERHGKHIRFIHLDRKIHAKLLIVDGKEAMFGSHNFVESGVQMGTQEIAFRTREAGLVDQLSGYVVSLQRYIPS